MKIEANKTYLTSGGYVVEIAQGVGQSLLSTVKTSPGVMYNGKNVRQANSVESVRNNNLGWYYDSNNGNCLSVDEEWRKKLQITEELRFSLPTLPTGYKWLVGFLGHV